MHIEGQNYSRRKDIHDRFGGQSQGGVNAGLKLLHSPERKYLSLTGIGLSIDPHSGVPPNSDAVVRGCGQTGGRCLGFRLCLTVGCV